MAIFYYKVAVDSDGQPSNVVLLSDGRNVPMDENNRDWIQLKAAIDAGGAVEVPVNYDFPPEAPTAIVAMSGARGSPKRDASGRIIIGPDGRPVLESPGA